MQANQVLAGAALALALGASSSAFAGPSNADVDAMFSYFGMEARGFAGGSTALGGGPVAGGDLHLVIEGAPGAFLIGGRLGGDRSTEVAGFDTGGRVFLDPDKDIGLFVGGGLFLGGEYVNGYSFSTGALDGVYGEAGVELPRSSPVRLTASLRLDLGSARASADSQVSPKSPFTMASLNVGVFFGGTGTRHR